MGSILASRVTKILELPGWPGESVTIRKLSGRQLGKAREETIYLAIQNLKRMGGPQAQKELKAFAESQRKTEAEVEQEAQADPLTQFDWPTVLEAGVVSWTFEDTLSAEALADLDEDDARHLVTEILRLTKPSLFQTADEAEAARKNG